MKITITKNIEQEHEVNVPKYWTNGLNSYFMLLDNAYIQVYDSSYNPELGLFPLIKTHHIDSLKYDLMVGNLTEISQTDFKIAYFKVTNTIEKAISNGTV